MARHGSIAQLGERLPCKQEVSGSSPLGSIHKKFDRQSLGNQRKVRAPQSRVLGNTQSAQAEEQCHRNRPPVTR